MWPRDPVTLPKRLQCNQVLHNMHSIRCPSKVILTTILNKIHKSLVSVFQGQILRYCWLLWIRFQNVEKTHLFPFLGVKSSAILVTQCFITVTTIFGQCLLTSHLTLFPLFRRNLLLLVTTNKYTNK